MPTARQLDALENALIRKSPYLSAGGRHVRSMGGAFRRMIDEMTAGGLLSDHWKISAAGIRALIEGTRNADVRAAAEERLPIAEAGEAIARFATFAGDAVEEDRRRERLKVAAEKAMVERRRLLADLGERFGIAGLALFAGHEEDDEQIRLFVEAIVDKEMTL